MRRGRKRLAGILGPLPILALLLAGCSDDDPAEPGNGDPFDEDTAVMMAEQVVPFALDLVEQVEIIGGGLTAKQEGTFAYEWNAELQRWEWSFSSSDETFAWEWFYTVRYIGADGEPQQDPYGAVRAEYSLVSTGSGMSTEGDATATWEFAVSFANTISGIGTETYLIDGTGSEEVDYSYFTDRNVASAHYVVTYEILGDGVAVPAGGGCPTGTIRFTLAPYTMNVDFDGTSTVNYTVYDGSGNPVHNGTEIGDCGAGAGASPDGSR
jgi:hypothetical protein